MVRKADPEKGRSMSNDLALVEQQLRPLTPHFAEALKGSGLAPEKLVRTVLICLERTPALLSCDRTSILQASMTAAVLGLEADGALGQFFMLPFKGKAQGVIGYRGFNSLAGRSGFTINGGIYREGDDFEYEMGSAGYVRHKPRLGAGRNRRILAAWATATFPGRSPIVSILDLDEIMFIKSRSPGARMSSSPWNDSEIGFSAMAEKSAKRRLARSFPINLMVAGAALEEAHEERQKHAYLDPHRGLIVDGEAQEIAATQPGPVTLETSRIEPRKFWLMKRNGKVACTSIEDWRSKMELSLNKATPEQAKAGLDLNAEIMDELRDEFPEHVNAVGKAFEKRIRG
jgi:recombination protein RecT